MSIKDKSIGDVKIQFYEEFAEFLNKCINLDQDTITELFHKEVKVNPNSKLPYHDTIQVRVKNNGEYFLRIIGLLNGYFMQDDLILTMVEDETTNKLIHFEVLTEEEFQLR